MRRPGEVDLIIDKVNLSEGPGPPDRYLRYVPEVRDRGKQPISLAKTKGPEAPRTHLRNEELLEAYLSGRRLGRKARETFRNAMGSLDDIVVVPLEEAEAPDVGAWYRGAVARCLAASTILLYATRLRELLEYAMGRRGLAPREARDKARAAMAGVPMADLRREVRRSLKGREALVTPAELEALLEEARHPRTRALISVLHESACRKGEILSLRIRDVGFEPTHVELRVLGKTGERVVPLVASRPHLEAWLEEHPDPRPSAPLFGTSQKGHVSRLHQNTPNKLLRDLCARAGLRHVSPHMLRHTRLTELAREGVGEYVLKSFAGWTPDSKMAARYVHLSGRDHVPAILKLEGVHLEEVGA